VTASWRPLPGSKKEPGSDLALTRCFVGPVGIEPTTRGVPGRADWNRSTRGAERARPSWDRDYLRALAIIRDSTVPVSSLDQR